MLRIEPELVDQFAHVYFWVMEDNGGILIDYSKAAPVFAINNEGSMLTEDFWFKSLIRIAVNSLDFMAHFAPRWMFSRPVAVYTSRFGAEPLPTGFFLVDVEAEGLSHFLRVLLFSDHSAILGRGHAHLSPEYTGEMPVDDILDPVILVANRKGSHVVKHAAKNHLIPARQ